MTNYHTPEIELLNTALELSQSKDGYMRALGEATRDIGGPTLQYVEKTAKELQRLGKTEDGTTYYNDRLQALIRIMTMQIVFTCSLVAPGRREIMRKLLVVSIENSSKEVLEDAIVEEKKLSKELHMTQEAPQ